MRLLEGRGTDIHHTACHPDFPSCQGNQKRPGKHNTHPWGKRWFPFLKEPLWQGQWCEPSHPLARSPQDVPPCALSAPSSSLQSLLLSPPHWGPLRGPLQPCCSDSLHLDLHTHTHMCTHSYTHTHTPAHRHVHGNIHINVHTCVRTHAYT